MSASTVRSRASASALGDSSGTYQNTVHQKKCATKKCQETRKSARGDATEDTTLATRGRCHGQYRILFADRRRNERLCEVSYSIAREEVETRVINAIVTRLSDPELLGVYRDEYIRERKERLSSAVASRPALLKRQADLKIKVDRLTEHMVSEELNPAAMSIIRQQINKAAEDLQIVETGLTQTPTVEDAGMPSDFAERFSKQLPSLCQALESTSQAANTAREILGGMIDEIVVEPIPGQESRIDCPWNIEITGPIQAVLEMPDVPDFSSKIAITSISTFARRGLMVPPA